MVRVLVRILRGFELQSIYFPSALSILTIVPPCTEAYFSRFPLCLPFMLVIFIENALDQCVAEMFCVLEVLVSYLS